MRCEEKLLLSSLASVAFLGDAHCSAEYPVERASIRQERKNEFFVLSCGYSSPGGGDFTAVAAPAVHEVFECKFCLFTSGNGRCVT